ncbi:glutathione ABC transporter substrate-binding protein [Oceanobacillus halotolerans]|uniref:glutathione ABC transporter substrate-binding protein n=1 Tax=Oceanobacillus halotolerans TaxID=2663380 RepID=UPI0013DA72FC|nr:glutathione ABC transporter substrate-binding protein [Oceanobacillus halotolerans]
MKLSKNFLLLAFFTISLSFLLVACASEPDEESSSTADNSSETEDKGGTLTIATVSDAVTLDPAGASDVPSYNVQYNIYETLVEQNDNMEPQPGLAESWEAIDDTTWEFKLREGVTFHDGSEFNAEVVKMNIERILDPKVASPNSQLFEMVTDIKVVDDYTVQFIMEYPFAALPAHLAHNAGGMVSPKLIEEDYAAMEEGEDPGSAVNNHPVGTSYFQFEEWQPGQYVKLVKNEDYWGEPAFLDSVTFKVVPEDLTRIAELETGESHISNPLSPADIEQVEAMEGLSVTKQGSTGIDYMGFNFEKEPFDDQRVRQAISMAIDKEQILEGIYNGVGIPAKGPLAPSVFGYDETISGIEYDPEGAKELLAEAGFEDGFSATIWTNDDRERIDIATNVQSQLSEIGLDIDIEILEWGAYLDEIDNAQHDMFILGWSNSTGDGDQGLQPLFNSKNVGSSGNNSFIRNDEIDALLNEARKATNEEERLELYSEVQEKLVDLAPLIYLLHKEYLLGVRDEVKGLSQLPTKMLQLKEVYIEE